jgi:hypothetical protein
MAADKPHDALGIEEARDALYSNYHALLDGLGWRPLTREWDYQKTFERIRREVFADEYRQLGT